MNAYKNILVALDGSTESENALKKAINLAKRDGAQLHICHVIEYYRYSRDDVTFKKTQENYGRDLLNKYEAYTKENGVPQVNCILEFGSAKSMISKKIAKDIQADLIVCGATGMNVVERMVVGSVSENIVRSAGCDVLVVRTNEE